MQKLIAGLAFFALLGASANADAVVDEVLVRRQGDNVNIRVNLRNPDRKRQPGPVVVELSVRADETQKWIPIKTWNDIKFIQPGYKVSRDFFEENNATLKGLAAAGRFQARASVKAPGVKDIREKTSWYDSESGK